MKIKVQSQPYNKVVKLDSGQKAKIQQGQPGEFIAKATNVDGITVQQGVPSTAVVYSGMPDLVVGPVGPLGPVGPTGPAGSSGAESLVSKTNTGIDGMWKGTVVYLHSNTGIRRAQANNDDRKRVLGLVYESWLPPGSSGQVITSGVIGMLLVEWVYVVADLEGFVGDQYYYLSPLQEGKITRVAPELAGEFVCPIGYSISATELLVRIDNTVAI